MAKKKQTVEDQNLENVQEALTPLVRGSKKIKTN